MQGPPRGFLAKAERRDGVLHWHPLVDHCIDVAMCVEAILETSLLRRRLARLGGEDDLGADDLSADDLSARHVAQLCVFALLHDAGKVNARFQNVVRGLSGGVGGHVGPLMSLLGDVRRPELGRLVDALELRLLAGWLGGDQLAIQGMLGATICHHGRPYRFAGTVHSEIWTTTDGRDWADGIAELMAAARQAFPEAFADDASSSGPLPATPAFQHAWNGVLSIADWLGSDTRFFPFTCDDERADDERADDEMLGAEMLDGTACISFARISFARAAARRAVAAVGLDVQARRRVLGEVTFDRLVPGGTPWPAQKALGALEPPPAGGVTVLEAPTGSGKTEAAALYCLRLLAAGHVDGLYFALPTRAAASQLYRRIQDMAQSAFASAEAPPVALAVPGYLEIDGVRGERPERVEGERLGRFDVLWPDEHADRLRHRGWAVEHPLKYFTAGLVVGTIDQVLLSALRVKHSQMRGAGLLRHLLVVDEVHASDAYMTELLEEVIAHQRKAGGHVVLMSATLTTDLRTRLVASGDLTERKKAQAALPDVETAAAAPYPLIVHRPWDGAARAIPVDAPPGRGKRVEIERAPLADDPARIAARAVEAARAGARVLVLRNTVADCLETQRAVEAAADGDMALLLRVGMGGTNLVSGGPGGTNLVSGGPGGTNLVPGGPGGTNLVPGGSGGTNWVPAPHHARFARADRLLLDAAIERDFGTSERPVSEGRIAVTTQTVEQSLDIDADLLLTDLCPIDVLLQRIGRLHRHVRDRPAGFESPRVVVLTPAERDLSQRVGRSGEAYGDHGLGTVYADLRTIETTWRLLEDRAVLDLPGDNRALVERALHPQALAAVADPLQDAWRRHQQTMLGQRLADRRVARGLVNDWSQPFDGTYAIADDRRLQTRLGESDLLVRFDEPPMGPFGTTIDHLTLRPYDLPLSGHEAATDPKKPSGPTPALPSTDILDADPLRFRVTVGTASRTFVYDRLGVRPEAA